MASAAWDSDPRCQEKERKLGLHPKSTVRGETEIKEVPDTAHRTYRLKIGRLKNRRPSEAVECRRAAVGDLAIG